MTNKLDSFLASATLARAKEQFLRTGLRYIQDGAALFMAYLDQQDAALQDEMARLRNSNRGRRSLCAAGCRVAVRAQ